MLANQRRWTQSVFVVRRGPLVALARAMCRLLRTSQAVCATQDEALQLLLQGRAPRPRDRDTTGR